MLMLGTTNPGAARLYQKLGFARLPGTNVWHCVCGLRPAGRPRATPEEVCYPTGASSQAHADA